MRPESLEQHEGPGSADAEPPTAFDRDVAGDSIARLRELARYPFRAARRRRTLAALVFAVGLVATAIAAVIVPRTYLVLTRVMTQRTVAMPRLDNPHRMVNEAADSAPASPADIVLGRDNLVSAVRGANLLAVWSTVVDPATRLKLRLRQVLRGPPSDSDRVDVLVDVLRKRLWAGTTDGGGGRGTVTVGLDWPDPRSALSIIETSQRNYLDWQFAHEVQPIGESVEILRAHLDSARRELAASVEEHARLRHGLPPAPIAGPDAGVAPAAPAAPAPPAAATAAQRAARAATAEEAATLQARLSTTRLLIADLEAARRERLTALQADLADLLAQQNGPANPAVVAVQQSMHALTVDSPQLETLRATERDARARLASIGYGEVASPEALVNQALARAVVDQLAAGPQPIEDPNVSYARHRVDANISVTEDLLVRLQSAEVELETARAAFRYRYSVIEPPKLPDEPTQPSLPLLVGGGVALSLLLALFAAIATDVTSGRLYEGWQLERGLGVPVLGQLGLSRATGFGARAATARPRLTFVSLAARPMIAAVVLLGLAILVLTGKPALAAAPVIALVAVYALWMVPLRYTMMGFMGLVVLADLSSHDPVETSPLWYPPLWFLRGLLIENLNKITGIEALRFSGAELCLIVMLGLLVLRDRRRNLGLGVQPIGGPRPLNLAIGLAFVTVLVMEAIGIARGGADVRQSLWQFRFVLWLPVITFLVLASFHRTRDFIVAGYVLSVVAAIKIVIGAYYYFAIARPLNVKPPDTTSHWDTVLFVLVIAMWVGAWAYRSNWRVAAASGAMTLWVLLGMVVNNRRTAFVSLLAVLVLLFFLQPRRRRRPVVRTLLKLSPLIALYLAAGTVKTSGIFAPASIVLSVASQKDASSATRDIENFNLLVTLKQNPFLGYGWGHMYVEFVKAYDISKVFAQYRYQAHNSVLWLWSIGGLVGFTALWMQICLGIFFATRAYRRAETPNERLLGYMALAGYLTYLLQAWSDLGTQSWTSNSVLACSLAVSAKLATATNAWPAGISFFRQRHKYVPPPERRAAEAA